MNCTNHPEVTASAFCRACGKAMCQECQRPAMGSIYCAEHLPVTSNPSFSTPPPPPRPDPGGYASSPYSAPAASAPLPPYETGAHPALALILGFIPGVGAIYNGQYAKGLIHAVVFGLLVSIVSSSRGPGTLIPLFSLLIAAWVFYMAFEAFHTARKRRYGVSVEEFSSLFDVRPTQGRFPAGALLLIGLGFILLLDTTDIISMEQIERYWPVGLILVGLYLLYVRLSPAARHAGSGVDRNAEAPK
jgi:hypothetical protein